MSSARRAILVFAAALLLAAPAPPAAGQEAEALRSAPAAAPEPGDLFLHPVRFELEEGSFGDAERGLLFVPQNRARPGSGILSVEFHRFPARSGGSDVPPVFLLHGGPGFDGLELDEPGYYEENVAAMARFADVVVVGQRGIGSSAPDTRCEGARGPIFDRTAPTEERVQRLREASRACREYWESRGLDLRGLNAVEAAHDVADVARALGYGRITLRGVSFGSHWAMAVLREHPDLVARALLSGTEGPDHTYDMPGWILNALERMAADAEEAPELGPWIPDEGLVGALEETVERLRGESVTVEVDGGPAGEERRVRVTVDLVQMFADEGYSEVPDSLHDMAGWPADILRLHAGRYEGLARRAPAGGEDGWSRIPNAAYWMLDCGSGISGERARTFASDPAIPVVGNTAWFYEGACPAWDADLGDDYRTGFSTDVPTLLVHGTWDLSTPLENALELEPAFGNGRLVLVERGTHGALEEAMAADPAFREAVLRFLETGSMTDMPDRVELPPVDWVVPAELPAAGR